MFTRTITIQANPPVVHVLYFDSESNAKKSPTISVPVLEYHDDYGQIIAVGNANNILSDIVANVSESFRAQGEMEIKQMEAQLKFDERIKKLPTIEAFVQKKRAKQAMQNMPRAVMPQGAPQ